MGEGDLRPISTQICGDKSHCLQPSPSRAPNYRIVS